MKKNSVFCVRDTEFFHTIYMNVSLRNFKNAEFRAITHVKETQMFDV